MNENTTQALIRLVRVLIVTALTFLTANIVDLAAIITDPTLRAIAIAGAVAIIEALLKAIGGPTQTLARSGPRSASADGGANRPSILSI